MAFGKASLVHGLSASNPPGGGYSMRAMEMFPDVDGLYRDIVLAIEICCGLALYLQSIDHRNSAYTYVRVSPACLFTTTPDENSIARSWTSHCPISRPSQRSWGRESRSQGGCSGSECLVDALYLRSEILFFDGCTEFSS